MAEKKKNKNKKSTRDKKTSRKRIFWGIFITLITIIAIPLIFLYLFVADYYKEHFYSNTMINGIDISNMTIGEAEDLIDAEVKAYRLTMEGRNGISDTISSQSINLHTVFDKNLSDFITEQKAFTWPVSLFKPHELQVGTMLEYDESLLEQVFLQLKFFAEENNVVPVNASISGYGENGYEVIPENQGAKVIDDLLYEAIKNAVLTLEPTQSLEEIGCYEKPEITSGYPPLVKALEEMNKLAGAEITYEFGEVTEVMDGSKISQWISMDSDFQVHYDPGDGIKEFVDYIGKTYNTFGKVRTFNTSYGDVLKIKGGDYGWWLNREQETAELTELVKNGERLKREPVYFQTAQQYGDDDIGDTYVEVNLTAQHLFLYIDGELILESDFVSGNVSKDMATPVGTYPVQYKDNDATLVGEDYSTPVKYWMPFNRNIGFHDTSWRKEFGKDIYLTKGSHGCINMPPKAAKKLFKYINRGTAVVVYELPGTENYEIKEEKPAEPGTTPNQAIPDQTATDQTATEQTTADQTNVDNSTADQTTTD